MKKVLSVVLILIVVLSLSACGKKETFTVTFDSVGGSSVESQTVEKGKCATKPSDPSKEGFTFVEWQLDGKTYNFETSVESNILLEAFYTINEGVETITIAFNSDNGEGIKTVSIAKGTAVGEPPTPNKSGYKFLGWFLETEKFNFDTKLETNTVLIAKWDVDKTASSNKTPDSNGQ